MKRWCQPFSLHTRSSTNSFVCNFLSSSAGFNLCSCFFRLTLAFWLSLSGFSGPDLHTALRRYPVNFLTSAVFVPFRSLQFWILTTQPLLFLSLFFLSPPHSGFLSAPLSLSLLRFSPFFPTWFPMLSFPVLVLGFLFVSFRPSSLRSHSCSTSACLLLSPSGLFRSPSLPFVRSGSLLTTQLPASSFPFFPDFPWQRFFRYVFPFRFACFHASLPVFGTQRSVFPFSC